VDSKLFACIMHCIVVVARRHYALAATLVMYLKWYINQCYCIVINCYCLLDPEFLANVNGEFTFAICYRPSVCRLYVVCNVRAPYSDGSNFRQYFYGIRYLDHPLISTENFTMIIPGEPLRGGSYKQEG